MFYLTSLENSFPFCKSEICYYSSLRYVLRFNDFMNEKCFVNYLEPDSHKLYSSNFPNPPNLVCFPPTYYALLKHLVFVPIVYLNCNKCSFT